MRSRGRAATLSRMTPRSPSSQVAAFRSQARALVTQMSLEEKARACSAQGFWETQPLDRLGLGSIRLAHGSHGVLSGGVAPWSSGGAPATCFPSVSALGCSFDTELLEAVGEALGREAQAQGVHVLLGPGLNMKRSPLAGRNFDTFSEDPLLAGRLMAAYVRGVQSQGVGVALKHFALNNQEHERSSVDAVVDERTLHETYLLAFEIAVREAAPWAVMSAANAVNGVPSLIATTSSPMISPARGVTSVAPTSTPRLRSAINLTVPF